MERGASREKKTTLMSNLGSFRRPGGYLQGKQRTVLYHFWDLVCMQNDFPGASLVLGSPSWPLFH